MQRYKFRLRASMCIVLHGSCLIIASERSVGSLPARSSVISEERLHREKLEEASFLQYMTMRRQRAQSEQMFILPLEACHRAGLIQTEHVCSVALIDDFRKQMSVLQQLQLDSYRLRAELLLRNVSFVH